MNENLLSILFFSSRSVCDLGVLFAAYVSKNIVFGCIKEGIKSFLMKCLVGEVAEGQVEKSHSSFKRAKYVLWLLSTKYNTFSAWRLRSNESSGLLHTSDKGLSLQFLGIVCALFISKPLCQTGCPENTLACFLYYYSFGECLLTTLLESQSLLRISIYLLPLQLAMAFLRKSLMWLRSFEVWFKPWVCSEACAELAQPIGLARWKLGR